MRNRENPQGVMQLKTIVPVVCKPSFSLAAIPCGNVNLDVYIISNL